MDEWFVVMCVQCCFFLYVVIGADETKGDKLRLILAQLDYSHQVIAWDDGGVPFRSHIYVPETHPPTNCECHEREDEGHVFKVECIYPDSLSPNTHPSPYPHAHTYIHSHTHSTEDW